MNRQVISSPGSNPFCGPAALSVLTNTHVDICVEWCKAEVGNLKVDGIFYPTLLKILKDQGFSYFDSNLTMARQAPGDYLICWRGHFGVSIEGMYFDNMKPTGTGKFYGKNALRVFKIERMKENEK